VCYLHKNAQGEKPHNEGIISATGKGLKYPVNSVVVCCALCVSYGVLCSVCVQCGSRNFVLVMRGACL
jgi:hypothetical protein